MIKIGLTGGIGSGKTTIAKIFELLKVPVYYADTATKQLYESNNELKALLKTHFGNDIYSDEKLNRSQLAAIVFNDPQKLELLNSMVHPITIKDAAEWAQRQITPYVLKEAALLFESGSVAELDYVIGVQAPQHIRIKRAMDRDGATREQVLSRMHRQIDETIKMRLCDFIIDNSEQQLVIPQVLQLHRHLLQLAAEKSA